MAAREFPSAPAQSWVPFLIGAALPERPFVQARALSISWQASGTPGATRVALSRLCADGSLERRRDGRQTSYRLTDPVAEAIVSVGGRVERFGRDVVWDGSWTIVLASVPDELRPVRRKLKSGLGYLGFGRLREAAWIAARECENEVKDLVGNLRLRDMVDVFVGRPSALADLDAILRRCWDLESLTTRYDAFLTRFTELEATSARGALSGEDAVRWWLRLTHDYRDIVYHDPELPLELLPPSARALRARVVDLYAAVHPGVRDRARAEVLRVLGVAPARTS